MSLLAGILAGTDALPKPIARLVRVVQGVLSPEELDAVWKPRAEASCNPLTGQCVNASGAIWYLLGGTEAGWRYRNIPARVWPEGGPHYFLEHAPTGLRVDATAGQYALGVRIPYELAEGRAPSTRGRDASGKALPPKGARAVVERVLALPGGREAVLAARRWSNP